MPFSSITEPAELAAAKAAFELAWSEIAARGAIAESKIAGERQRLAYIVMALRQANAEHKLVPMAVEQFFATVIPSTFGSD